MYISREGNDNDSKMYFNRTRNKNFSILLNFDGVDIIIIRFRNLRKKIHFNENLTYYNICSKFKLMIIFIFQSFLLR